MMLYSLLARCIISSSFTSVPTKHMQGLCDIFIDIFRSVWPPKCKLRFTAIAILLNSYFTSNLLLLTMVRTRSQLGNLSKDELINEALSLENFKNDINAKFSELHDCFNDFQAKYEMVNSNLSIWRRNELLRERITQLERNNLNNAQYSRRDILKINPVPSDIADDVLKQSVCQALSLTGISVELDDLQACHCMRKKDRVVIKL